MSSQYSINKHFDLKKIGILGGMSWQSTSEYYRLINRYVSEELGGLHSAEIIIYSFDFHFMEKLQTSGKWGELAEMLVAGAKSLAAAGVDLLVIATNTMHKLADEIKGQIDLPLIHIADATAEEILNNGIKAVRLLGTRFTIEEDFYRVRLTQKYGVSVLIPEIADRELVHKVIYQEFCHGQFEDRSRNDFVQIIAKLESSGADGVILGCTEIALLVKPADTNIELFDTTALHARKIVNAALSSEID